MSSPIIPTNFLRNQLDNRPKIYPERLNFHGMHSQLNPAWYEKAKVIRNIAIGILTGSIAFGSTTIGLTSVIAIPAFTTAAISCGFLSFSSIVSIIVISKRHLLPFWQDPTFRIQKSEAIFHEIKQNHLSYKDVRIKYGELIDSYNLFTDVHLNAIYQHDIDQLDYEEFKAIHGVELIAKLSFQNKNTIQEKFFTYLNSSNWMYKNLVHEEVWLELGCEKWLQKTLLDQACNLSYSDFIQRHTDSVLGNLQQAVLDVLAPKYSEWLVSLKDWSYKTEISSFSGSQLKPSEEIILRLLNRDALNLSYEDFKKAHGLEWYCKISLDKSQIFSHLHCKFLECALNYQLTLSTLQEVFDQEDIAFFGLHSADFCSSSVFGKLKGLKNKSIAFKDFRKEGLEKYLRFINVSSSIKNMIRERFFSMSYVEMINDEYKNDRLLLSITDQEIVQSIQQDANCLTLTSFIKKHSFLPLEKKIVMPSLKWKSEFELQLHQLHASEIIAFKNSLKCFSIEAKEYLLLRWKEQSIAQILNSQDKKEFIRFYLSNEKFREDVKEKIAKETHLQGLLKHDSLYSGILTAETVFSNGETLQQKFEREIKNLNFLEAFFQDYANIFNYKCIKEPQRLIRDVLLHLQPKNSFQAFLMLEKFVEKHPKFIHEDIQKEIDLVKKEFTIAQSKDENNKKLYEKEYKENTKVIKQQIILLEEAVSKRQENLKRCTIDLATLNANLDRLFLEKNQCLEELKSVDENSDSYKTLKTELEDLVFSYKYAFDKFQYVKKIMQEEKNSIIELQNSLFECSQGKQMAKTSFSLQVKEANKMLSKSFYEISQNFFHSLNKLS